MAKIRKRVWKNKSGKHTAYEITYVIDGKQYKKGGYASLIEAQIDLPNVVMDCSTDIRFFALKEMFINRHCALHCKQSTIDLYKRHCDLHLSCLNNKVARDIQHKDIENLIFALKKKKLSNLSINKMIQLLRAIYNYGIESKILSSNPILKSYRLKEEKKQMNVLNENEINLFLKTALDKNFKIYAFLSTAIYTGMRRGELLALEWSDIDFKNQRILVNKQLYNKQATPPKNNKHRYIDIPSKLIEILTEYKKTQTVLSKIVFCNTTGQYMHPSIMERRYFCAILNKVNEQLSEDEQIKLRFHDLRHTYATLLLSKGVPIKYVQEQLGHSSAKMTLDVYASFLPSVKFEALNILDNLQNFEPNRTQIEHEKVK